MSSDVLYTLFYLLISFFLIYPPNEFVSEGITIASLLSNFLGSEHEQFVSYQIKRTVATLFIHSLLPLGYVVGLLSVGDEPQEVTVTWQIVLTLSLLLPLTTVHRIVSWSRNNWQEHPIVRNLLKFTNNTGGWSSVASDINVEYRRVDKICIQTNAIMKIIATDNWILKITPYNMYCAHQSDACLVVNKSDTHTLSYQTLGEVQYINIEVKSARTNVKPFAIRLNALDFKDLQDRIARPITVLPNVTFHKTLMDRFIETFREFVKENPRFAYDGQAVLESCIGCMQAPSNVKLQNTCNANDRLMVGVEERCGNCYCRPMWCLECMARWFATRQDSAAPETWLGSKCTCPMCRAKFCLLDVALVEENNTRRD